MAQHDAQFRNAAVDELVRAPHYEELDRPDLPPMHASPVDGQAQLIARLQASLAAVQPRLEAFSKLEALARERRSTPEGVAVQVTIDVLEEERDELLEELLQLQATKKRQEEDIDMITEQRQIAQDESEIVVRDHAALVEETAELLDELDSIRADAVRLMGEKAALEEQLRALRSEVGALSGEETDGEPSVAAASDVSPPTPAVSGVFDSSDEGDEAVAFDRFFDADVGTDKARAWMLK